MHAARRPVAAVCVLAFAGTLAAQALKTPPTKPTQSSTSAEVGGKTFAQWLADLKHPDASKRADAIINLLAFGETAGEAVPQVIDRLQDGDMGVRAKAVLFLKNAHVPDRHKGKVVEGLARCLGGNASTPRDPQGIVRYEAALALLRFPEDGKLAVNALLQGMTDPYCWEIRQACIVALRRAAVDSKTGPDPRATRALVTALRDPVERVRLEATISLGAMTRPQDPHVLDEVIGALQRQLKVHDKPLALWSHVSLMALDDKVTDKSLTEIGKLLHSPEREVRLQCLMALAAMGGKARACIPDMLDMLEDKEKEVVYAAIASLPRMDDHSARVLGALIKITKGSEQSQIFAACVALGEIGVAQPEVVDAMTAVTQRKELESQLRQAVEKIIENLKKPPAPAQAPAPAPKK
jgi:HEAT repeat protein